MKLPFRITLGLTHEHKTRLERLVRHKHSTLLRSFVNYGRKSFVTMGPGEIFPGKAAEPPMSLIEPRVGLVNLG